MKIKIFLNKYKDINTFKSLKRDLGLFIRKMDKVSLIF